jgi:hypothetical protein
MTKAMRQQAFINKQKENFELQADMDEASQQLLHEYRHAEAKLLSEMNSESSTSHITLSDGPLSSKLSVDGNFPQPQSEERSPTFGLQS